jgi:uncharacterized protein
LSSGAPAVFVDATHWIALLHPKDNNHQRAKTIEAGLGAMPRWTTELILIEILDYFADRGEHLRLMAVKAIEALGTHPQVTIIPLPETPFESALAEFAAFRDKGWSITDCASFVAMRQRGITTAATFDSHFEQARFIVLR